MTARASRAHFRLRYDVTDTKGAITLRRAGRLHHLNLGVAFARRRVMAIVDEQEVTVVALDTGEVLSTHLIEPRPPVLAEPTTRPRPLAGVSSDRLLTCAACRDSCVAYVATHDIGAPDRS